METASDEVSLSSDFFNNLRHFLTFEELGDSRLVQYLFDDTFPDILDRIVLCGLNGQQFVDFVHFEHTPNQPELLLRCSEPNEYLLAMQQPVLPFRQHGPQSLAEGRILEQYGFGEMMLYELYLLI